MISSAGKDAPGRGRPTEVNGGDYMAPPLACDIVMKGGITSGVVYPGAVTELGKRYAFRSIGGASAGAIAAALVAAAEFRRQLAQPPSGEGFAEVAGLPDEISTEENGDPLLLRLFQPDPATRSLFNVAISFMRRGAFRGTLTLLLSFWRFPLLAAAIATASVCLSVFADARSTFAVVGVAAATWILVIGLAADLLDAVRRLPANDFGLCRLGPQGTGRGPALTEWLHKRIQAIAGKPDGSEPLTFAQLWGAPELRPDPSSSELEDHETQILELSRKSEDRTIDLQMMTTNLTHGRPMRVPVPFQQHNDRLEEGGGLLFDPTELGQFFPPGVIAHLEKYGPEPAPNTVAQLQRAAPGRTFRHFPIGPDLPVVVATRMSLSFPLLISAIPLWELDFQGHPDKPPLKRVVFSDGGITSNFPVHFFDSPAPTRPTFGLHLAGFEAGEAPDPSNPALSVRDPAPVAGLARESWVAFESLFGFFVAIKDAAQNWRDNAQSQLPGFRERIIHVKLAPGEGGLNLAMKQAKIDELSDRGAYAGHRLVELFSGAPEHRPQPTERWNDSRFARYRVTMSLLERFLRNFERGYTATPDDVTIPYPDRIRAGTDQKPYAFGDPALCTFALNTTGTYLDLVEVWNGKRQDLCEEPPTVGTTRTLDDEHVPRPPSTLRSVPPV